MIGHLHQLLASSLLLVFGLLAFAVSRRAGPARRDRSILAWRASAAYFVVGGAYSTAHAILAAASHVVGYKTAYGRWVGSWAIGANLARGAVAVVFGAVVLALMTGRHRWVFHLARASAPLLLVTAVIATAVCQRLDIRTEFGLSTGLAVLSMLTAIVIMGALFFAVINDGMDQLLWLALVLYALKETLTVSHLAVIAWWIVAPHAEVYYVLYASSVALHAAMCAVAARRLRLAAEGRRVPALFERLYPARRAQVS